MSSHSSRVVLPGWSGLTPMPRKMSGSAISMIEELIVAISTPSVVFDNAIHLYRGPDADPGPGAAPGWPASPGCSARPSCDAAPGCGAEPGWLTAVTGGRAEADDTALLQTTTISCLIASN